MKTTTVFSIALAAALFWSGALAAQRGQSRGPAGRSGGGSPSINSWPQGGPGASQGRQDGGVGVAGPRTGGETNRPEVGQRGSGRAPEDHAGRQPETTPASGQRTAEEQLARNPKLSSKLQGFFLPGSNLAQEAAGFKNFGEFVAAAHVSHNLGIPFGELKGRMTNGQSLGDAIHTLKPDVNHPAEERKARDQARKDLQETGGGS